MKKFFIIVLVILVALFFARNLLIKTGITLGSKIGTGLYANSDKVNLDLVKSSFDLEGFKLYNPEGYLDPFMVSIPKILVDAKLSDLAKKKLHVESVIFNLDEFYLIKNESGQLNIDTFKAKKGAAKEPAKKEEKKPAKKGAPMAMQLDYVHVTIGKVIYKDYSKGTGTPAVQEYPINIDKEFENVTDPKALISGLISTVLAKTSLASLANIDVSQFSGQANELAASAMKNVSQIEGQANAITSGLSGTGGETTNASVAEIKDKMKSLTDLGEKFKF
jgi:hypothetical protein